MRKILLALVALIGLAASSSATTTTAQAVRQLAPNSVQCSSVTIGLTAVEISGNQASSTATAAVSQLDLFPIQSTNVYCSHSSSVSAAVGNANIGVPIPGLSAVAQAYPVGYGPTTFIINPTQPFYCIGFASGGALVVCKTR